jgi:hypothetical protein
MIAPVWIYRYVLDVFILLWRSSAQNPELHESVMPSGREATTL